MLHVYKYLYSKPRIERSHGQTAQSLIIHHQLLNERKTPSTRLNNKAIESNIVSVTTPSNPACCYQSRIVKLENDVKLLKDSNNKLTLRVGDELLADSSDSSDDNSVCGNEPNTRYMQEDNQFNKRYFYITNVSV